MKKVLLAAAAAIALLGGAQVAAAKGFYVGAYGGLNWDDVISAPGVSENTGYAVGGVLGTTVDSIPGLRVEADLSFRQNDVDINFGCGSCVINASHETTALLANVVYDFATPNWPVHPYVLAGAGYAHTQGTFEDISLLRVEASGIAWQLGAGLNATISDGVKLGVGYRYFQAPEIDVFTANLSDGTNQTVQAELTFAFN